MRCLFIIHHEMECTVNTKNGTFSFASRLPAIESTLNYCIYTLIENGFTPLGRNNWMFTAIQMMWEKWCDESIGGLNGYNRNCDHYFTMQWRSMVLSIEKTLNHFVSKKRRRWNHHGSREVSITDYPKWHRDGIWTEFWTCEWAGAWRIFNNTCATIRCAYSVNTTSSILTLALVRIHCVCTPSIHMDVAQSAFVCHKKKSQ